MDVVPRHVQPIDQPENQTRPINEQPLSNFRSTPAWVLLGEPGAGKSASFKMEAAATSGHYLTARELIAANPAPEQWRGKTLFIDALDESRAEGVDSLTLHIGNQLRRLGCPPFRLACRAADWYGSSDRADLQHFSPDGKLITLQLSPLDDKGIRHILQRNHGITDPEAFAERSKRHGIAPLLRNPQTLGLIAKATREERWPESRAEVYRLACETLSLENNRRHRDRQRTNSVETVTLLQAAGQLFAVLLLTGKSGIALDQDSCDNDFPTLRQLIPADTVAAAKALQSALFIPATNHDERVIPCHRSIAEYLAANWLGERLDRHELPIGRLLNLLLGCDGGVVADLRGLFAWLTQCSTQARLQLIDIDPLGIVLYGDAHPLSATDKRYLLQALRQQAECFPGFRWYLQHDQEAFGALADEALAEDFRQILENPCRDEATQAHMDCVLDILRYGGAMPALAEALLARVKDSTLWFRLRNSALDSWLKLSSPVKAKELLVYINSNRVEDDEDRLLSKLLEQLYPSHLEPDELLQYLHPPKNSRTIGGHYFWEYCLPQCAPDHHLPSLLAGLSERHEMFDATQPDTGLPRATNQLLVHALGVFGESSSNEQLFTWLGAGADEYGHITRDKDSQAYIQQWLESHPERYKGILELCIKAMSEQYLYDHYPRLHDSKPPSDLGFWFLQRAASEDEKTSRTYLANVVHAFSLQHGADGLSLEIFAEWMQQNPDRASWLKDLLYCPIESWRLRHASNTSQHRQKREEERHKRTISIDPHIPAIATGMAAPHLLNQLAGVWLNHFSDVRGETPSERFANYSKLGDRLMMAAESGFKLCLQRDDLPSSDEIIALNLKKRFFWIGLPCLLGLQLLHIESPEQVQSLPDDLVERLLAFRLTTPRMELSEWLAQMARQRPKLFANILVRYASTIFKVGESSVELIHLLGKSNDYAQVTALAIPSILKNYPLRAKKWQLNSFERLLDTALAATPESLDEIVRFKLSLKGLDGLQKTLWLATALLRNPEPHEKTLWRHIGKSLTRASLLADFISRAIESRAFITPIPKRTLGRLIELIAPHAELERVSGVVTKAMKHGDQIRTMINLLGTSTAAEAERELQRLLDNPALNNLRYEIQSTLNQQRNKRREAQFSFLTPAAVAHVLANKAPASIRDLTALALGYLDEIALELRHANDDGFRTFWNVTQGKAISQREENLCRDALLQRLRPRLSAQGVGIAPEADYAADKRADLQLDYRNQYTLPIEIKRDSHPGLWKALRNQLIAQYVNEPKAQDHGIYLVFWFGDPKKPMPATLDRAPKPRSAQELQLKLEEQLSIEEKQRVFVKVMDVSWQ